MIKLNSTTSKAVISSLKAIFSRHGVPSVLISDNGPQFDSSDMKEFANTYAFQHITSSPRYPQSNGLAERTVKTMKGLLKHTADPYMALLSYRSTPLPWCNYSPAELLMGRKVKTDIPQTASQLTPQWHFIPDFQQKDRDFKVHRNRQHLNRRLNTANDNAQDIPDDSITSTSPHTTEPPRNRIMTRTQTGTDIRPPNRLTYD